MFENNYPAKIFFKYYLPAIFWLGVIWYLSSMPGSGSFSFSWDYFITRKLAHIVEYAVLGILLARIFNLYSQGKRHLWTLALLFGFALGMLDEIHQTFVFGRQGNFLDAFIDAVGTGIGVWFYSVAAKSANKYLKFLK